LAVRGTPGPATTIVGALLLLVLLVTAGSAAAQSVAPSMRDRVLVVPFENLGRDPRLSWIGEGAAILLTDQIRAAGTDALTRVERLRIFERLQVPPLAALSHATVIRIGQLVGASDVVTGDITRDGDDLIIKARRICLDAGVLEPEIVERAGALDVMQAFGRVGRRLLEGTRGSEPSANGDLDGGPPLAAFEQYVKGLLAGTPANQTAFLQNALRAHPAYDAARLALWQVQTAAGDHRAAIETVRPVGDASPLAIDAGFLRSQSLLSLGQDAAAADELQRLQARVPSPVFLNNLGVVALRDPSLTARLGHPAWYFGRARTLDALDADYVFNLGYAYLVDGDPEGASYWLKECVRLTPTDGAAHALLAQTLFASGAPTEAGRELALAKRLSSAFDALELRAGTAPPRGLERLKDTLDPLHARRIDAAFEMVGQRDQQALARFYLERGRRLADKELDRDAEAELTRALYLSPYNAEAHLLLGRIFLRTGRPRQAIDAVKISLWSEETAAAHLVLAEAYLEIHDDAVARAEAERALTLDPNSIQARRLIERLAK
jgi:tetratricopeptide (TPR) repeat protein/TolB-like protein